MAREAPHRQLPWVPVTGRPGMSVRSKTILFVDDEAPQCEQMRRALKAAGYRVLIAADYGAAVAIFQVHQGVIDMLVTDLALPGKNGYKLGETLRALQPQLKVLFTSGHSGAELTRFHGINPSGDEFLAKPYKSADLVGRVRLLMERPEQRCGSASC